MIGFFLRTNFLKYLGCSTSTRAAYASEFALGIARLHELGDLSRDHADKLLVLDLPSRSSVVVVSDCTHHVRSQFVPLFAAGSCVFTPCCVSLNFMDDLLLALVDLTCRPSAPEFALQRPPVAC